MIHAMFCCSNGCSSPKSLEQDFGGSAEGIQGFQPAAPEGDFAQQGFQYQEQSIAPEPAPGPSNAQPSCPLPNKTTKLVALQCPQVRSTFRDH